MSSPAATIQKKKSVDKSKLKKTIKNVLCKPNKDFWPQLSEKQSSELAQILTRHKVEIPEFKKLHWSVLKNIPKNERPKEKRKSVQGFKFGMLETINSMKSGKCHGAIINADFTPRIGIHHVVETALVNKVPIVCMPALNKLTKECFGFPSSCVILNEDECNIDVRRKIEDYWNSMSIPDVTKRKEQNNEKIHVKVDIENREMDTNEVDKKLSKEIKKPFEYVMRIPNGKAFVPPDLEKDEKVAKDFAGQNFIKFSDAVQDSKKPGYGGMVIKRISNNPKRKERKMKNK